MSQGKTEARFYGGSLNGEIWPDTDTRFMVDRLEVARNAYFAVAPNDQGVEVRVGKKRKNWMSSGAEVYFKRKRQSGDFGVEYQFAGNRDIGRCAALTQKGEQCLNAAREGSLYCHKPHNPDKGPIQNVQSQIMFDEIEDISKNPPVTRGDIPKP